MKISNCKTITDHLRYWGEVENLEEVNLIAKDCSPVLARAVQYLERYANQSNLPLATVFTAIINRGLCLLWNLPGVEETDEFLLWSLPEPVEALKNSKFSRLESLEGQTLSVNLHQWCFHNCERLAESLGIEDPGTICLMAMIAGLVNCTEVSHPDKVDMRSIIGEFVSWIGLRLIEVNRIYRVDDAGLFKKVEWTMP